MRPTRGQSRPALAPSYLVLLRMGFALPRLLPGGRWSLTPPFHPYQRKIWDKSLSLFSVGGLFSAALSVAPEFPPKPPRVTRHPGLAEFGLSSPALRQKQPAVLSVCFFQSQPQNIFPQSSHSTTCVNLCISMVSCGRSIVPHPPQELFTIVIAATPLPAFARICS